MLLLLLGWTEPPLVGQTIQNPSFEADAFANGIGLINEQPAGTVITGWAANGNARAGLNPSTATGNSVADNGVVPHGTNVAFLRSVSSAPALLTTTITGLVPGTIYRVRFRANCRASSAVPNPSYSIDGKPHVPFVAGPAVDNAGVHAQPYYAINILFTATATAAALQIGNTTAADSFLLLDDFSITTGVVINVLNTNDSGPGSLRAALAAAAATTPVFHVIKFAPALSGQTILLSSELSVFDLSGVAIDSTGLAAGIAIDGGSATRVFNIGSGTSCLLRRVDIEHGRTTGSDGAGIRNHGTLNLVQCAVVECQTNANGAGIANLGNLELTQCTIGGSVVTAATKGGGIFNAAGATLTLNHCTIAHNLCNTVGGTGDGICNDGAMNSTNSIIGGNDAATPGQDIQNNGSVFFAGENIVDNYVGTLPTGDTPIDADPGVNAPVNNGGPTKTSRMLNSSVARDAAVGLNVTTDQRGKPIVGGAADIGAFELQAGTLSVVPTQVGEGFVAKVQINRGDEAAGPLTVRLVTSNGTATAPADYTARPNDVSSDITIPHGVLSHVQDIPTTADFLLEGNQTFNAIVSLPTPVAGASIGAPASAVVTIVDPFQVTSVSDDGPGSLRAAMALAKTAPGPNSIHFSPTLSGKTIILGGELVVSDGQPLLIDALNLPAGLTIQGGPIVPALITMAGRHFFVSGGSGLTIAGLTLTNGHGQGTSPGDGGSIHVANGGTFTARRCTFRKNVFAVRGGAIFNDGTLTLLQCTFHENQATTSGGAFHNVAGDTATVTHCTMAGNAGGSEGGGFFNAGNLTLDRCISNSNNATTGPDGRSTGAITFLGTNIVTLISNTGSSNTTNGNNSPGLNPQLVLSVSSNGGPTPTIALAANSQARDAGTTSTIQTDQRGLPVVGAPDLGAYELQQGGVFTVDNSASSIVSEGANAAVVIRRSGGAGAASVRLFTTPGTASNADFTPRPDDTSVNSVVNFAANQATANVFIATDDADGAETHESFTATLGSPTGGATIGTPSVARFTILDPTGPPTPDLTDPGVPVISFPGQSAVLNVKSGDPITVTGTATDNLGVQFVTASLNGGSFFPFVPAQPFAPSTPFSGNINPVAGTNTLVVRAADHAGNDRDSALRTFKVLRDLTVAVAGHGSVSPGFSPFSFREVGLIQTITATPGSTAIFSHWAVLSNHTNAQLGITASALQKPTLSFIFRETLLLRAHFVPNPYLTLGGEYNGLVRFLTGPAPGPGLSTEGLLTVTVQTTGAFSGKLLIDGLVLNVAGAFDPAGVARFGTAKSATVAVPRPGKPSLLVGMTMDLSPGRFKDTITGTIFATNIQGDVIGSSQAIADRAFYNGTTNPVFGIFLGPSGATQPYTIIMTPIGNVPAGLGPEDFPQGTGFATATVNKAGLVTLAGIKLPDGTSTTATAKLSKENKFPIFIPLYGNKGFYMGDVLLQLTTAGEMTSPGGLFFKWLRPEDLTKQHYPAGWKEIIDVTFNGARYTPVFSPASSILRNPDSGVDGDNVGEPLDPIDLVNGNALLTFSNGLLSFPISKPINVTTANAVTKIPANDTSFTLLFFPATGTFSGQFVHEFDTGVPFPLKTTFQGVVYEAGSPILVGGHGFFLTRQPTVIDFTGKSGQVRATGN